MSVSIPYTSILFQTISLQIPLIALDMSYIVIHVLQHFWYISDQVFIFTLQEVRQLECLCKQLYESADGNLRVEAEKALVNFQNAPDTLAKCQLLLDRGDSSYAQAIAANTLTKLISRPAQGLSLQQRIDIRKIFYSSDMK